MLFKQIIARGARYVVGMCICSRCICADHRGVIIMYAGGWKVIPTLFFWDSVADVVILNVIVSFYRIITA